MKIKSINVVKHPDLAYPSESKLKQFKSEMKNAWHSVGPVANPMTRYSRYSAYRPSWMPPWKDFGCVVTAEDGTQGFAVANHGKPVATIMMDQESINEAGDEVTVFAE